MVKKIIRILCILLMAGGMMVVACTKKNYYILDDVIQSDNISEGTLAAKEDDSPDNIIQNGSTEEDDVSYKEDNDTDDINQGGDNSEDNVTVSKDITYRGWMSNEDIYWRDHEERILHMENPTRVFYQVAGVDESDSGRPCGIIQKAEYTLALSDHTSEVKIILTLKEPLEEIRLTSWGPADYDYDLEVSDTETGELLVKESVKMCVDAVDTVEFVDMDGDGYLDMHIAYPEHSWLAELAYLEQSDREENAEPPVDPACEYFMGDTPECWFDEWYYGDDEPKTYSFARLYESDDNL